MSRPFSGAKVALFVGPDLLCLERDHKPDIPWPGHWDLPGGGREGGECPEACVCRETFEETGLSLGPTDLVWRRAFDRPHGRVFFFAAHLGPDAAKHIVMGDEGCGWRLFAPDAWGGLTPGCGRRSSRMPSRGCVGYSSRRCRQLLRRSSPSSPAHFWEP